MAELHHDGKPMFHAESVRQWRGWLHANHDSSSGVWLVVWKKHTGKPALKYPDTVDEALAYGWIDSRPNRLDDERAMRWFCPRKPTSPWSRINRAKIARLTEAGRITPAGQALVDAAKANGAWTVADEIEDLVIPDDLAEALRSGEVPVIARVAGQRTYLDLRTVDPADDAVLAAAALRALVAGGTAG